MQRNIMRLVGVAAAVLITNATAVPVPCGALDAVWQEQAAVTGNYPECESYYDSSNLDQTVHLDSDHPHLPRLNACKRYGATIWSCPTRGDFYKRSSATTGWGNPGSSRKREVNDSAEPEPTQEADKESLLAKGGFYKRFSAATGWGNPGSSRKREVNDSAEPEPTQEADQESLLANGGFHKRSAATGWEKPGSGRAKEDQELLLAKGGSHKRSAATGWEKPGSGRAKEVDHETLLARGSFYKRSSAGAGWDTPGSANKREVQGTKGDNGNWPPHKREALVGIETALAASNVDAKVDLGLDVASKPPGNWPPHMRLDVADEE